MLLEVPAGEGLALWMWISMLVEVPAGEGLALWMWISMLVEVPAGEGLALWIRGGQKRGLEGLDWRRTENEACGTDW